MIQTRRIVVPVAVVAIVIASLALPAASVHAAPASTTETSVDNLWQPLTDGLARLQAGVLSLFATSTTDSDSELDTDAEIGRGADPNGITAGDPGTTSTPTQEPDGSN